MRSIWKVAAAALMASSMIGAAHAAPAGWQSCAADTKDSVTISEAGVSYSVPRWALKQVSKDLGVSWISDHGLCNEKLHKVVICNPWDEDKDKDPVCTSPERGAKESPLLCVPVPKEGPITVSGKIIQEHNVVEEEQYIGTVTEIKLDKPFCGNMDTFGVYNVPAKWVGHHVTVKGTFEFQLDPNIYVKTISEH